MSWVSIHATHAHVRLRPSFAKAIWGFTKGKIEKERIKQKKNKKKYLKLNLKLFSYTIYIELNNKTNKFKK